jgi:hypothetical protein
VVAGSAHPSPQFAAAPLRSTALVAWRRNAARAFMQFACMYDPAHILSHILPIPGVVLIGGRAWFVRRGRPT